MKTSGDPLIIALILVIIYTLPRLMSEVTSPIERFFVAALGYGLVFLALSFAFYLVRLDEQIELKRLQN